MVFFNCNACGEALKKSAVEKHYLTKCRQCEVLSCVDCGKDFWGDDYQKHVKCISEEEKYSGKDFKPKPGANKGEKKQELWIQQVHEAVQNATGNAGLRNILQKLVDYPNIPRKQKKFENFLKNSLRVNNPTLTKQVWDAMAASMTKPEEPEPNPNHQSSHQSESQPKPTNGTSPTDDHAENESSKKSKKSKKNNHKTDENSMEIEPSDDTSEKKNKRERKEERREKAQKKQKKDKNLENGTNEKKKKRKREDAHQEVEEEETVTKKSKKEKKCKAVDPEPEPAEDPADTTLEEETPLPALTPNKFKWESTIARVLKSSDDHQLAVKKLKKKVLSEYFSLVLEKNRLSEADLSAKFEKKITRNARFKVHKDRVTLVG